MDPYGPFSPMTGEKIVFWVKLDWETSPVKNWSVTRCNKNGIEWLLFIHVYSTFGWETLNVPMKAGYPKDMWKGSEQIRRSNSWFILEGKTPNPSQVSSSRLSVLHLIYAHFHSSGKWALWRPNGWIAAVLFAVSAEAKSHWDSHWQFQGHWSEFWHSPSSKRRHLAKWGLIAQLS